MALQRTLPDDAGRTAPTGSIRQWCNLVGCTGIHWREDSDNPALVSLLTVLREHYLSPPARTPRRAFRNARSVAMNRASIAAMSFEGAGMACPVSRARTSA